MSDRLSGAPPSRRRVRRRLAGASGTLAHPPARGRRTDASTYWEERAQRFARDGAGLRAVCSYGMPWFYNAYIHCTQWLALRRWLTVPPGTSALDVGCGVGRWSRLLARRGATVTGIDLAPTMIDEAQRRAREAGLTAQFLPGDLTLLEVGRTFDLILGVTVLQHILEEESVRRAILRLAAHLRTGGRIVLLEAAPSRAVSRCDTTIFRARTADEYRRLFETAGLRVVYETGVDPAPFKTWYLPVHRRLWSLLATAVLFLITAASLPLDLILGRRLVGFSWHKVFVLERA